MTDWIQKMKDIVQPEVPEPVVSVGMLQPAGTWGAAGIGQLSGLAGMVMRKAATKRAGGMGKVTEFKTRIALIALSEKRLYAFNAKPKGRSWKVEGAVGDWDRSDLAIETTPGKLATKVVIDVKSTGAHFELEATTVASAGNFTGPFLAELTKPQT